MNLSLHRQGKENPGARVWLLKDETPFAKGGHRSCYRHPSDSKKCIKVLSKDWKLKGRRLRTPWLVRIFRQKWYFHDNLCEHRFLRGEEKRLGEVAWEFLPRVYELVETDVGDGLIVGLITDADGAVSMTLVEYLWKKGLTEECREALDRMWAGLLKHRIFVQGRLDNLVVQQRADGTCHCYAIDGYGLGQWIPLAKWFKKEAERKIHKKQAKCERAISKLLKERENDGPPPEKGFLIEG